MNLRSIPIHLASKNYMAILVMLLLISCNSSTKSQTLQKEEKVIQPTDLKLKFTKGISAILEDTKGNYWFGSNEGVCLFDGESFQYFTVEDGLTDNQIRSIQEDNNGNVWFGTARGVSSYDGKKIINHPLSTNIFLPNEWAKTDEDLWFSAGNSNGIYRYDGQKLHYLTFPKAKLKNPNNVYHVTGFSKGKNNQIWIATYAGVFGFNGKTFTIINDESLMLEDKDGYLHIRSILEDSKGNLWIGNNGIGVLLKNKDGTINFSEKNGLIHSNSSRGGDPSLEGTLEHVFAIEEDRQGNIWFGDRDTGLWKYDGKAMTNFTLEDGLPSHFVQTIYSDSKGNLWLGTMEEGIYQFNGNKIERVF